MFTKEEYESEAELLETFIALVQAKPHCHRTEAYAIVKRIYAAGAMRGVELERRRANKESNK